MFKIGDSIYLYSKGLVVIKDIVKRDFGDGENDYFQISREDTSGGLHYIPRDRAAELCRKLIDRETAEHTLEILRRDDIEGEKTPIQEVRETMDGGDSVELAMLLRKNYGLAEPIGKQIATIVANLEDLLLDEIAKVLDMDRDELVQEMRQRYQAIRVYFEKNQGS